MFAREHFARVPTRTFRRHTHMTDLITSADAARQLGYTVQHIRRLVRQGTLAGVKMGRDWLVQQSSVQELVARRENLPLPLGEAQR